MKNLKGVNWLSLEKHDSSLQAIDVSSKELLFEVPFDSIASTSVINNNDLQIEFNYDESNKERDNLCEVRFYFPP